MPMVGKSSNLTSPNGLAQQAAIQQGLQHAVLQSSQVSSSESHGTGTALGDPIEVHALNAVLVTGRPVLTIPLSVGAFKSQLGHLEAVAGAAGLVKVTLALRHCAVAPNLHLRMQNPHFGTDSCQLQLAATMIHLETSEQSHGVNSFGMSGTNSHAVVTSGHGCGISAQEQPTIQYQHSAFVWWDASSTAGATEAMPLLGASTAALEAGSGTQWLMASCAPTTSHRQPPVLLLTLQAAAWPQQQC